METILIVLLALLSGYYLIRKLAFNKQNSHCTSGCGSCSTPGSPEIDKSDKIRKAQD